MEVVDDEVDDVEAEETVFIGAEDAMLDSMSGDITDSGNKQDKWVNALYTGVQICEISRMIG